MAGPPLLGHLDGFRRKLFSQSTQVQSCHQVVKLEDEKGEQLGEQQVCLLNVNVVVVFG